MEIRTMKPLNIRFATVLFGALMLIAPSSSVLAAEGVTLIDQGRAMEGGVTPGDGPGFPVEINRPGSYRLVGNLQVPNANTTAIRIKSTNVTLDLNGFTIQGVTECGFDPTGATFGCHNTGTGIGIEASNPRDMGGGVVVANGIIQKMGRDGVALSRMTGVIIRNIISIGNGRTGISGFSSLIEGVSVSNNGGVGIEVNYGTLKDSMSTLNGGDGVFAFHALLMGNFVQGNSGYGLNGQDVPSTALNFFQGNGRGDINPALAHTQLGRNTCGVAVCP
jgi:hypothetical protein